MKLDQIRKNAELVSGIRKLAEDQTFRALIEMLEDEHPRKVGDLPFGSPVYDVARLHDRQTGYELALSNMRRAQEFIKPTQDVKQTYPEDQS